MKKRKLTPNQDYYCELRAKQLPQYTAYKIAYNRTNASNSVLRATASKLESKPYIKAAIKQRIAAAKRVNNWSVQRYISELLDAYELIKASLYADGIHQGNTTAYFNAIDRLKSIFNLDEDAAINRHKLQMQADMLQAQLKVMTSGNDEQMTALTKLLDDINKQIEK